MARLSGPPARLAPSSARTQRPEEFGANQLHSEGLPLFDANLLPVPENPHDRFRSRAMERAVILAPIALVHNR